MSQRLDRDWLHGSVSLGAAAGWTAEEIRLVAELGYGLAEQGRHLEAVTVFEGLTALAPATPYFQSALGALRLRLGDARRALQHLDRALAADPQDVVTLVNRAEAALSLGDRDAARKDLRAALQIEVDPQGDAALSVLRARALLATLGEADRV